MMQREQPIPITILTGFLGSGKTTLLNRILNADHGLRIAVLVNDFGAVNIDSLLVASVKGEKISLANGCICCTIRDDLIDATEQLLNQPQPPDYIIWEKRAQRMSRRSSTSSANRIFLPSSLKLPSAMTWPSR